MIGRGGIAAIAGLALVLPAACTPAPEHRREVHLAYQHSMVTLDPHGHNDSMTGAVLGSVYESLVYFAPGQGIVPSLAASWTTPDDTTWRLRLRPDVLFHDGRRMTGDDVIASFERVRANASSAVSTNLEAVETIRLADGSNDLIEVTTRAPCPLLLTRLANIAIVPRDFDPATPVGTGPYRWVSAKGQGPYVLQRWSQYWGERADVAEVVVHFIGTDALLSDPVLLNQLDCIPRVTKEFLAAHPARPPWRVVTTRSVATTVLGINVNRAPFNDPRVRQAVDLAIDRHRLLQTVFPQGGGEPAVSLVPAEVFGFCMTSTPNANLEQARVLMQQAGIAPGTEVRLAHASLDSALVEQLIAVLGEIGLVVIEQRLSYDRFYRTFADGLGELFVFGWNFRFADASHFLDGAVHTRDPENLLGRLNGSGYSNTMVDRWIERAMHEPRSAERLKLLRAALAQVAEDRPYLPLYHPARFALLRNDLVVDRNTATWLRPQDLSWSTSGPPAGTPEPVMR